MRPQADLNTKNWTIGELLTCSLAYLFAYYTFTYLLTRFARKYRYLLTYGFVSLIGKNPNGGGNLLTYAFCLEISLFTYLQLCLPNRKKNPNGGGNLLTYAFCLEIS